MEEWKFQGCFGGKKGGPVNNDFVSAIGKIELEDSGSCGCEMKSWLHGSIQACCCLLQQNKD